MKRSSIRKSGKSETAKLQKKCDVLLTPIIKKLHPKCEGCGSDTEVAHHFVEKSRSSNLRYNIDNLIPLCHSCHAKIHNRFGNSVMGSIDVSDTIRAKRGEDWFNRMRIEGAKVIKVNVEWYIANLDRLEKMLDN
jgi:hypothetical protein